jgi:hypothetical protein
MSLTFGLTVFAWIFFRAESVSHAFSYIYSIFSDSLFSIPIIRPKDITILIILFIIVEWIGRTELYGIEKLGLKWKPLFRYLMYIVIIITIFWFWGDEQQFIYFQF